MKTRSLALSASLLVLAASLTPAQAPPAGFTYQTLTDGTLNVACSMAFAPDGRLFLAERITGNIRIFQNGAVQPGNWATIPKTGTAGSEQGLLGIAIDPNFLVNRFVYVFYTRTSGIVENVVARLQEVGGVGTGLTVLSPVGGIASISIHNGGRLVFGKDGKLYIGTGDRSSSATAQDLNDLHGKILRMNTDGSVPSDNPFGGASLVYSYGHRNQYGLTVHPVTGDIFQTENGQNTTDEINRIVPGGNYGWPMYEGPEPVADPSTVDALATYSPTPDPTGTCFYKGTTYPAAYVNEWFFIKYTANQLTQVTLNPGFTAVAAQVPFDDLPGNGFDVLSGPDGNLWYLTNDSTAPRGGDEIGRYVHSSAPFPAANITAVSNQAVGGALTLGYTGLNGDLFLPFASTSQFAVPASTPYGDLWINPDILFPILPVVGDNRVYLGVTINNNPAYLGKTVHTQAARIDPLGGITLTNLAETIL